MAYTKGYSIDASAGADTVKEAIVDKLDALGIDAIYAIMNGVLLTSGDTLASKEYVDLAVAGSPVLQYFLTDSADAIGGIYYVAAVAPSTPQTTLTKSSVANGTGVAMFNWITPSGVPGMTTLKSGTYDLHIHANVSSLADGQVTQIYFTIVKRATGGTETTLMTSEVSGALTATASPYSLHASLAADETLDATDRLMLKLFANRSGGGTPNIVFTMEGASDSHFGIPAHLVNVDHGVLAGLTDDDHTQYIRHNLSTAGDDFLVGSGSNTFIKKTLAETKTILGLGAMAYRANAFVDRGDPTAWDYLAAALTKDAAWHDLDLSAIVPAGASAVVLRVATDNNTLDEYVRFRKNGNADVYNVGFLQTIVANRLHNADITVACDANRVIEYFATNGGTWSFLGITVKGWIF